MLIAYVLVVISYLFFGLLYYFTFPGPRWCMADIFMEVNIFFDDLQFLTKYFFDEILF